MLIKLEKVKDAMLLNTETPCIVTTNKCNMVLRQKSLYNQSYTKLNTQILFNYLVV